MDIYLIYLQIEDSNLASLYVLRIEVKFISCLSFLGNISTSSKYVSFNLKTCSSTFPYSQDYTAPSLINPVIVIIRLEKCDGISGIRRLTKHHPDTLHKDLQGVVLALTTEVKNLRSSVCRMSAICLGDMFVQLKKRMDAVSR